MPLWQLRLPPELMALGPVAPGSELTPLGSASCAGTCVPSLTSGRRAARDRRRIGGSTRWKGLQLVVVIDVKGLRQDGVTVASRYISCMTPPPSTGAPASSALPVAHAPRG